MRRPPRHKVRQAPRLYALRVRAVSYTHLDVYKRQVEGRVTDEDALRREIYGELKPFFQAGLTKRVANLLEALRLEACAPDLPIKRDRICTGRENLFRGRRSV